jgi:hypothetical protein
MARNLLNAKYGEPFSLILDPLVITATQVCPIPSGLITLENAAAVIELTFETLEVGAVYHIEHGTGTQEHTVTLPSGWTFTSGAETIATLDAQFESITMLVLSTSEVKVLINLGSVALSEPA